MSKGLKMVHQQEEMDFNADLKEQASNFFDLVLHFNINSLKVDDKLLGIADDIREDSSTYDHRNREQDNLVERCRKNITVADSRQRGGHIIYRSEVLIRDWNVGVSQ